MQRPEHLSFETFLRPEGQWLRNVGPDSDVVVSSRVRLARNIRGYPFPIKLTDDEKQELVDQCAAALHGHSVRFDLTEASSVDRLVLVERHLISRELASGDGARSVIFGRREYASVMINEEDHLRIQCMHSGFELDRIWKGVQRLDLALEQQLPYAFNERLGFLTACPTNTGTGMRVSVMVHLPALTLKEHVDKVKRAVDSMNLAIRGLYGEGSRAAGDFYQISNQATLGRPEEDIISDMKQLIPSVIEYERGMRKRLVEAEKRLIEDKIDRALATLRAAHRINVTETMEHLSLVRLGVLEGLIEPSNALSINSLNHLFILCQPGHLQMREGKSLTPDERDELRAELIKSRLADSVN